MLLVSGSKNPERWIVPGGGIEPTEDTHMAALRECNEEAGVTGQLGRCIGSFEVYYISVVSDRGRSKFLVKRGW